MLTDLTWILENRNGLLIFSANLPSLSNNNFKPHFLPRLLFSNSVTFIGDNSFWNCSNLKSVNIPNSVNFIGEWAFAFCDHLTSITISNGVTSIEPNVFAYCSNLKSVNIPNGVTFIGKGAFTNCSNLTSDSVINNSPVLFGWWVSHHQYTGGKTINEVINDTGTVDLSKYENSNHQPFTIVGDSAFANCSSLTSINIPNGLTSIGRGVFANCLRLKTVCVYSERVKQLVLNSSDLSKNQIVNVDNIRSFDCRSETLNLFSKDKFNSKVVVYTVDLTWNQSPFYHVTFPDQSFNFAYFYGFPT